MKLHKYAHIWEVFRIVHNSFFSCWMYHIFYNIFVAGRNGRMASLPLFWVVDGEGGREKSHWKRRVSSHAGEAGREVSIAWEMGKWAGHVGGCGAHTTAVRVWWWIGPDLRTKVCAYLYWPLFLSCEFTLRTGPGGGEQTMLIWQYHICWLPVTMCSESVWKYPHRHTDIYAQALVLQSSCNGAGLCVYTCLSISQWCQIHNR